MKPLKLMILWSMLLLVNVTISAQFHLPIHFRVDLIAGVSPGSNPNTAGILVNRQFPDAEFMLNIGKVKPQYYIGLKTHFDLGTPFFLEAGAIYTQRKSMYVMTYTYAEPPRTQYSTMGETESQLLIPASIGVSVGRFDVISGLTAISVLSKKTELSHIAGYQSDLNSIRMGWHTGVRHTFKRSMIGIEYQGSLNRVGQGASVNGKSLELMNVPGRFVLTMQYGF